MLEKYVELDKIISFNSYIDAERANRYKAAKIKKTQTAMYARAFNGCSKITDKIDITFVWYLKNRRRDIDNIAFNQKFILDGMVCAGIIPDDNLHYVQKLTHIPKINTTLKKKVCL